MKVTTITVHYNLKQALPGYGSVEYGSGVTIELEQTDTPESAYLKGWLYVRGQVLKQMGEQIKSHQMKSEAQHIQGQLDLKEVNTQ